MVQKEGPPLVDEARKTKLLRVVFEARRMQGLHTPERLAALETSIERHREEIFASLANQDTSDILAREITSTIFPHVKASVNGLFVYREEPPTVFVGWETNRFKESPIGVVQRVSLRAGQVEVLCRLQEKSQVIWIPSDELVRWDVRTEEQLGYRR